MKTIFAAGAVCALGFSLVGCDPEKYGKTEPVKEETVAESPKPEVLAPIKENPADGDEVAVFQTGKGRIVLMFYPERAPKHVENFKELIKSGFYDGTRFHRVAPGFMIQGGDPYTKDTGKYDMWGTGGNIVGGQEKYLAAEFNEIKHVRGILSMARAEDPNSASCQFFIMHDKYPSLDGQYSAFGKVVEGLEVVDKIVVTPIKTEQGVVFPTRAVVLEKATIEKWPLK